MKNTLKTILQGVRLAIDKTYADSIISNEEILELLLDLNVVQPIADNNKIYTTNDGKIYIL